MAGILLLFLRGLITFAAGLGAAKVLDKVAGDKLPVGTTPVFPYNDASGNINWTRVIIFMAVGAIAVILVKFVGRKLKVNILK